MTERAWVIGIAMAAIGVVTSASGTPPIYLDKTPPKRAAELKSRDWIETIAREIPPLSGDPGGRMPMIMWKGVGFEPLRPDQIAVLRSRGLCQHLQLSESMIPAAKVLASAGVPIILMEGRTDNWPYSLAKSPSDWAHQFDVTYEQPWFGKEHASAWHGACPHRTQGWNVLANRTKQTLLKFRDAGVRVDAVLVDYEGDPYPWSHLFDQLRHCRRCRRELPPEIIHNKAAWREYAWQQYVSLYDEHFAKLVREVFPDALVTNWHVVFSSESTPVRYFVRDVKLPALKPKYFSATNPIAYASDMGWHELWKGSDELTQDSVDRFYAKEIVQQVVADKRNRDAAGALHVRSIPWVARVCKIADNREPPAPIMSRSRYRQTLGQLWGLGIHTMQIFNPLHDGYEELAITELQDAVAAYDEMLKSR
jgi:hypothetical protein